MTDLRVLASLSCLFSCFLFVGRSLCKQEQAKSKKKKQKLKHLMDRQQHADSGLYIYDAYSFKKQFYAVTAQQLSSEKITSISTAKDIILMLNELGELLVFYFSYNMNIHNSKPMKFAGLFFKKMCSTINYTVLLTCTCIIACFYFTWFLDSSYS